MHLTPSINTNPSLCVRSSGTAIATADFDIADKIKFKLFEFVASTNNPDETCEDDHEVKPETTFFKREVSIKHEYYDSDAFAVGGAERDEQPDEDNYSNSEDEENSEDQGMTNLKARKKVGMKT